MSVPSLPNEKWRRVKTVTINNQTREVKGEYYVSNLGRARNRTRLLKTAPVKDGYLTCNIDGQRILLHRLVAQEFVPNQNPKLYTVIDHIDKCKTNNNADNLRWTTQKLNTQYAVEEKAKPRDRSDILIVDKDNNMTLYDSQKAAAEAVGADSKAVNKVLKGEFNQTKGYKFLRCRSFTDKRGNNE